MKIKKKDMDTEKLITENSDIINLSSKSEIKKADACASEDSLTELVPVVGPVKEYLRGRGLCRVTFRLPEKAAASATSVNLVGDFNNWDVYATPMGKQKDGSFLVTLDLESDKEYQYRFLIDETKWENDWKADRYDPSPYGHCDNSVIVV